MKFSDLLILKSLFNSIRLRPGTRSFFLCLRQELYPAEKAEKEPKKENRLPRSPERGYHPPLPARRYVNRSIFAAWPHQPPCLYRIFISDQRGTLSINSSCGHSEAILFPFCDLPPCFRRQLLLLPIIFGGRPHLFIDPVAAQGANGKKRCGKLKCDK